MKHLLGYNDWLFEARDTAGLSEPVASSGGKEVLRGIADLEWGKTSHDWWAWGVDSDFAYKTLEIAKRVFANSAKDLAEVVALEEKIRSQNGLKREDVDLFGWWLWAVMWWRTERFEQGIDVFGEEFSAYCSQLLELLVSDQNNPYTSSWPWFFSKKYNPNRFYSLVDRQKRELARKKAKAGDTDQDDVAQATDSSQ